ncbi:MAG: hypothetical protein JO086_03415, partial [Acidimicrobiia bacterium]|nr:hypothetical protein [Acidimicrobiia bacterium]
MKRRLALLVVAALAVSTALVAAPAKASSGSFTQHTWPASGVSGARDYWLYVPAGAPTT